MNDPTPTRDVGELQGPLFESHRVVVPPYWLGEDLVSGIPRKALDELMVRLVYDQMSILNPNPYDVVNGQ